MKIYNYKKGIAGTMVIFALAVTSCNKWLDVQPDTQVTEIQQLTTEQGYIDALIGTYQKMAATDSYGMGLTFGTVDVLAQIYQNKASQNVDLYGQLARYNYLDSDVRNTLSDLWFAQYSIIAQANYILKDIDANKSLFKADNYNLVKGEALAIRALIHLDLLRLFAPAPVAMTETEGSGIPYMRDFTVNPKRSETVSAVLDAIITDLKEAESLLASYPEIDQIPENAGSTSLEIFTMFRQNRLNYWAVKGLLARASLYADNKPDALRYANEVIESGYFHFINGNTNSTNPTLDNSNAIFSTEHVFSVYRSDMKSVSDRYFKTESSTQESEDLFSTLVNLNNWYEIAVPGHAIDIRGPQASASRWNQFSAGVVYTNKYHVGANVNNVNQKLIPIIKLPEMYYIAAEASETLQEGIFYLNSVRTARLIPPLDLDVINTAALLDNEIFKEYRKEFYAEGQLWHYYKRKNFTTIQNTVGGTMTNEKYVFPKPNDEVEFGLNN